VISFESKKHLKTINEFNDNYDKLLCIEIKAASEIRDRYSFLSRDFSEDVKSKAEEIDNGYKSLRQRISANINEITRIAQELEVSYIMTQYPAPAFGGPVLDVNVFRAILQQNTGREIPESAISDALNELLGECKKQISKEFWKLINPFYWILELLKFVLRIPFLVVSATGFNISKIEDHFLARIFKLIYLILLLYVLARLGFTGDQLERILPFLK